MKNYYDIVGDGGSDVLGQVRARQAAIAGNLSSVRMQVAVGSGKGGVGKSTLTMLLARALVSRGQRVAILDADLNGPCQARLGGLEALPPIPGDKGIIPPRTQDGIAVISMGAMIPETEAFDFESVTPNETHTWRATREFTLLGDLLMGVEWGPLDYLLIDLPPGAERLVQYADFLGPEVSFLLVTIPSDMSRGVVARSLVALRDKPNRLLGYVSNMDGYLCPGCGDRQPLFQEDSEVLLNAPLLGRVPFAPAFAGTAQGGLTADLGADILALAETVETLLVEDPAEAGQTGVIE